MEFVESERSETSPITIITRPSCRPSVILETNRPGDEASPVHASRKLKNVFIIIPQIHTFSVCPFRVNDDTEYEEEELFEVYLKTSDNRIIIPENMSSIIVHIFDPEDGRYKL